jgi:hypothetical protein
MGITVEKKSNRGGVFFDITVDGVTIYGCQRKTGTGAKGDYDFISTPRRKYQDKDGQDKWADIVKFDKDTADRVLAAVKAQEGDGSGENGEPF